MHKRYLLFDIDGTLVNTGGAGMRAMKAAIEKHLGDGNLLKDYSFAGRTDSQIFNDMVRKAGIQKDKVPETAGRLELAYITNLESTLKQAENFRLYPHVREVLDACRKSNAFDLALLTGNIREGAKLKLTHADLWKYFGWGVFGNISEDRIHLAKEACRIITRKAGNINRKDIIIIGDTTNDIRCGQAIAATTIAFAAGFEPEGKLRRKNPDYIINDFKELYSLFEL